MLQSLLAYCQADELARLQAQLQLMQLMPTGLTVIEQGLSNHSFKLCATNIAGVSQDFLLRVNSTVTDAICERGNEIACWRAAEQAKLAPMLFWVDEQQRFYLAEWLTESSTPHPELLPWQQFASNGERIRSCDIEAHPESDTIISALEQAAVKRLLNLLIDLRQLPAPALDISLEQQWHIYLERLQQMADTGNYTAASSEDSQQWNARLLVLQQFDVATIFSQLNRVLLRHQYCHRDLSASNLLLCDDKLLCIDFEYCCSSHPLFELAGVIATHRFSVAARQQLIHGYLEQHPFVTAEAISALPAALDIFWLYSCAWALQMADSQCKDAALLFSWFDNYLQLVGK